VKNDVTRIEERVRIKNPSQDRIVEVEVSFKSENYQKCETVQIGKLEQKVIKNG
jgi:hypothetical protein